MLFVINGKLICLGPRARGKAGDGVIFIGMRKDEFRFGRLREIVFSQTSGFAKALEERRGPLSASRNRLY